MPENTLVTGIKCACDKGVYRISNSMHSKRISNIYYHIDISSLNLLPTLTQGECITH